MSTKSLKVLNEEMSELWEKSYSVPSFSDDSFSESSEDASTQLSQALLKALRPPQLAALRRRFTRSKRGREKEDINDKVQAALSAAAVAEGIELPTARARNTDILTIDETTFVQAIRDIFESSIYTPHAHHLFLHLDPFCSGRVSWNTLLDRLEAVGATRVRGRDGTWQRIGDSDVKITRLSHCQHECIVKLVPIETATSFCYCVVTRGGRVGLYSGVFELKYQYHVWSHRKNVTRRIKNCWVTDAVYMPDVQCLTVSSSDRCLTILDASTLSHTPLYCITSLPNIPTCLCYMPASSSTSAQPELMFGDERGRITRITFLQAKVSLFYKVHTDRVNCFYWMELSAPPQNSYIQTTRRLAHPCPVVRMLCLPHSRGIVSGAAGGVAGVGGVRWTHTLTDYSANVDRGVTGVSLSPSLLAVGTRAGTVQLYTHTATRVAVLSTVTSTREAVLDVAIVDNLQLVVAFTDKCVLHIWDVYEECLLQSIQIKFPFVGVLGKKMEFGPYCIHPGPAVRVVSPSPRDSPQQSRSSLCSPHHEDFPSSEADLACTSIVLSCGDSVCRVSLSPESCRVTPLSPPRDVLAPRTPGYWDIDLIKPEKTKTKSPRSRKKPISTSSSTPYPELLTPDLVHHLEALSLEDGLQKPFAVQDTDLEELLEKADLKGLMEKDFVLMAGMKHDLNKKLSELNKSMDYINRCVNMNAAHLSIRLLEPTDYLPANRYTDTDATCRSGSHTYRSSN